MRGAGPTRKTRRRQLPGLTIRKGTLILAEVYRGQGGPYAGGGRHDVGREREGGREHRAWSGRGKNVGGGFLKVVTRRSLERTPGRQRGHYSIMGTMKSRVYRAWLFLRSRLNRGDRIGGAVGAASTLKRRIEFLTLHPSTHILSRW